MKTALLFGLSSLFYLGVAPRIASSHEMLMEHKDAEKEKEKEQEHERTHFFAGWNEHRGTFFGGAPKREPFFKAQPKPPAPVHAKK